MSTNITSSVDVLPKPRVLIADDSRIVRATLIKHIQGLFEFREALDGEQAWQILLIDPSIRVVITDLTMPKLDGYGLLQRIRASKINRIRNIPVIVVSGSDDQEERDHAKAAGATDLITKGIDTAQLLSRLDILSKLVNTQHEFERSLEALVHNVSADVPLELCLPSMLAEHAQTMLANAIQHGKNFVMINIRMRLRYEGLVDSVALPPRGVVNAVGQLLQRTIRQTDRVAKTGDAEFTLATGSINFDSARHFSERISHAITNANLIQDEHMSLIASCGVVALYEKRSDIAAQSQPPLDMLQAIAHRRAALGLENGYTGVVGPEEEVKFEQDGRLPVPSPVASISIPAPQNPTQPDSSFFQLLNGAGDDGTVPDLATLLKWIREGRHDQARPYIGRLAPELQMLVELALKQSRG